MNMQKIIPLVIFFFTSLGVNAANFIVEQKDKAFSKSTLSVKVGDKIEFKNMDPYNHNIFSLSDIQLFDLGSYPKGESRTVTFEKPGTVDIECAIHPAMKLTVDVSQ
ncbi:MAG: plastocyanin/azurin family copper-binding protein [Pseudomonadota bacterium]